MTGSVLALRTAAVAFLFMFLPLFLHAQSKGTLTLSATSVVFGSEQVNTAATPQEVTVTSSGAVPVTISAIKQMGAAAFRVSGANIPTTLNPGQEMTLTIGFDPGAAGAKSGTIEIVSDASPSAVSIELTGTAVTPLLTVSSTSVVFGNTTVGVAAEPQTVTLTSSGTVPVTINSMKQSGAPAFTVSGPSFPLTLNPGQKDTVTIGFEASSAGVKPGNLVISSNANPSSIWIALSGTAVAPGVLSGISCSSGSMTGAGTDLCTVTLTAAAGAGGLTVNLSSSNASVTVPASVTVAQGALNTTFSASVASVSTAQTVTLTAAAGSVAETFGLQLNAAVPTLTLSTTSVSFGDVTLGTPATQTVTLMSTGTAPVTVNGASVSGSGFSTPGLTTPLTLNPGDQATVDVQFDPTAPGTSTGAVSLASNCSMGGNMGFSVSGTGQAPVEQVDLTWDAPTNSSDPVAGYNVYRAISGSQTYELLNPSPNASTEFTDTSVVDGTAYTYYVESVDAEGNTSGPSNTFTISVPGA